ncbi:MAG: hypothetical protein JSV73_01235 [Flavobacteriaceae bacterium]|nr:MAG: hypothetical protein JSV73_01235 [Flavobacteriaceae bacterium]
MLPFFRKIRWRLAQDNQFFKYSRYAIGEIVLVVIGILIALQINNWNEQKKKNILEIEILTEIRQNLIMDFHDHNENLGFLNQVIFSSKIILDHLNNNIAYHDSLTTHFSWLPMAANFDPITSGYNLWLSEGTKIIGNDSLRIQISKVYDQRYRWLRDFLKDRQYNNNQPLLLDMMKKFKTFELLNSAQPRNYEALKSDDDFKILVQQNAYTIKITLNFYNEIVDETKKLIDDIEIEIQKLNAKI